MKRKKVAHKKLTAERVKPKTKTDDLFAIKCDNKYRLVKASGEHVVKLFIDPGCKYLGLMKDLKKEKPKVYKKIKEEFKSL